MSKLTERNKNTPNERISKYKERIQNLKDKIAKATDKNSDTVKLQKNKMKVIQQTMNNFKQTQAIKKEKEKDKLSEAFVVQAKRLDYGQLLPMLNRMTSMEERRRLLSSFINTLNDFYKKQGFDIKIQ